MCQSCEVVNINGMNCHETGCPDAWESEQRECRECGRQFTPADPGQRECDGACYAAFHGFDTEPYDDDPQDRC